MRLGKGWVESGVIGMEGSYSKYLSLINGATVLALSPSDVWQGQRSLISMA